MGFISLTVDRKILLVYHKDQLLHFVHPPVTGVYYKLSHLCFPLLKCLRWFDDQLFNC